jgi:hypothetical protein
VSRFEPDDPVVLPSGDTGRVLCETPAGVEVRYDEPLNPANSCVTIAAKYLRKYVPGLRLPRPVRIG